MKLKIEYQKREKLRNSAVVFPVNEENLFLMIYIYNVMNRRYKSNDYVCIYNGGNAQMKDVVASVWGVVVKLSPGSLADCMREFIISCPYRRVTFVGSECLQLNNSSNKISFNYVQELPRRTCNTFDFINPNLTFLTSSQRISANRAYKTCRHTYMYVHTGKPESRGRELLKKKFDNPKFSKVFEENIDNLSGLKRKVCTFDNIKTEVVSDHEAIMKRLSKKFKSFARPIEDILKEYRSSIITKQGSYGLELSKKRDYSIIDKRISDQIKKNRDKSKKKTSRVPPFVANSSKKHK